MVVVGKAAVRRRRSLEMTQRSERRDEEVFGGGLIFKREIK